MPFKQFSLNTVYTFEFVIFEILCTQQNELKGRKVYKNAGASAHSLHPTGCQW